VNESALNMIRITRLDGKTMVLNAEWIQSVEETPDTLITLSTGFKLIVKETVAEVVAAYRAYKRDIAKGNL
jgi:flagellar protein FlbD